MFSFLSTVVGKIILGVLILSAGVTGGVLLSSSTNDTHSADTEELATIAEAAEDSKTNTEEVGIFEKIATQAKQEQVTKQERPKEENFWEHIVSLNTKFRETAREYKETISENPHHLQNRLDELDANIRIIRNTYFSDNTGDLGVFNKMFKILEDSYQREWDYVQNVLNNTNKRLKYFDDMIAYYDNKVNYYIQNSTKFVSMETWIADGDAFYKGKSDEMYKVLSDGIQDFSNFVDNMKRKDEEYQKNVTLIKESLENYSSSYSSYTPPAPIRNYNYYDNIVNDLLSKPSILNPIRCETHGDYYSSYTTCY